MTTKLPKIALLGCGWLGLPLAESLISKGYSVKGSTTTHSKTDHLKASGIEAFHLVCTENGITGDIQGFLDTSDLLIINIPPKLRNVAAENFVRKISFLIPYLTSFSVKKVIFVSATSVYSDELSYNKVTEGYFSNPNTENGKQLLETERLLQNNPDFRTTVVRFGGLIGNDRHPVKHLAGRENIENPDAPINMIHLEDCIGILHKIIETETWGETFNAVAPNHPSRETYYCKKALEMKLPLPTFANNKPSVGKIVSSEKVQRILKYSFRKTDF
ncbi:NAD(P)-binding domain-containing protein [Flavobacterium enshiense]|uniref:NAD(P)-binding domain-containing protein n=1 Tax=Flavobacterium enshiense TaxID=1341165 RepID=UPI00345DCB27